MTTNDSAEWKGSVRVSPSIVNVMRSHARIKLDQAIAKAFPAVGQDSQVVSAIFGIEKGFLVYNVLVADKENEIYKVIVDAGNGSVLSTTRWEGGGGGFGGGGASGTW